MKIADILKTKGPVVFTINEDNMLSEALNSIVTNRIGVLVVLNSSSQITGIISERDILKASFENGAAYLLKMVKDVMTRNVVIAEPEDSIEYVEQTMTQNRFRHVPIIKDNALVGLISIGDLVKALLSESRSENKYMKDYISGFTM